MRCGQQVHVQAGGDRGWRREDDVVAVGVQGQRQPGPHLVSRLAGHNSQTAENDATYLTRNVWDLDVMFMTSPFNARPCTAVTKTSDWQ